MDDLLGKEQFEACLVIDGRDEALQEFFLLLVDFGQDQLHFSFDDVLRVRELTEQVVLRTGVELVGIVQRVQQMIVLSHAALDPLA